MSIFEAVYQASMELFTIEQLAARGHLPKQAKQLWKEKAEEIRGNEIDCGTFNTNSSQVRSMAGNIMRAQAEPLDVVVEMPDELDNDMEPLESVEIDGEEIEIPLELQCALKVVFDRWEGVKGVKAEPTEYVSSSPAPILTRAVEVPSFAADLLFSFCV